MWIISEVGSKEVAVVVGLILSEGHTESTNLSPSCHFSSTEPTSTSLMDGLPMTKIFKLKSHFKYRLVLVIHKFQIHGSDSSRLASSQQRVPEVLLETSKRHFWLFSFAHTEVPFRRFWQDFWSVGRLCDDLPVLYKLESMQSLLISEHLHIWQAESSSGIQTSYEV